MQVSTEHSLDEDDRFEQYLDSSSVKLQISIHLILSNLEASHLAINELSSNPNITQTIQTPTSNIDTLPSLADLFSTLSPSFDDPGKILRHHLLLRNRRTAGTGRNTYTNQFWLSPKITRWPSTQESSLIIVGGPFNCRSAIVDFGASVIQTLSASATPTVWALTTPDTSVSKSGGTFTPMHLMRYLTHQALCLTSKTEKETDLWHSRLGAPKTTKDWFDLFRQVISECPDDQVYLVIDLAVVHKTVTEDEFNLVDELNRMLMGKNGDGDGYGQYGTTKIKVLLLIYESEWSSQISDELHDHVVEVSVAKSTGSRRHERTRMQRMLNVRLFPSDRGGPGNNGRG